jgi:hypothetical protein
MSGEIIRFEPLARLHAAPKTDKPEAAPQAQAPTRTVRNVILECLLGVAASGLAYAAGIFLGIGERHLAIAATFTVDNAIEAATSEGRERST